LCASKRANHPAISHNLDPSKKSFIHKFKDAGIARNQSHPHRRFPPPTTSPAYQLSLCTHPSTVQSVSFKVSVPKLPKQKVFGRPLSRVSLEWWPPTPRHRRRRPHIARHIVQRSSSGFWTTQTFQLDPTTPTQHFCGCGVERKSCLPPPHRLRSTSAASHGTIFRLQR
jgi:hypothetical protein